jgi:CRP-like cAMP-binding protein
MSKNDIDYLRNLPPFQNLNEELSSSLAENLHTIDYPQGEVIFNAGDQGDSFYVIKKGTVSVFITAPDSDEKVTLSNLHEGDYFGEMALLTGEPRSASVETASEVTLIRLEKKGFEKLLEKDPKISIAISHMISQRLMQANLERAASEQFYRSKISPSGQLTDFPIMQVLKFCEENSLTGRLLIEHQDQNAELTFMKGNVQKISMDNLTDAEAMDTVTQWKEGKFKIEPSLFSLADQPEEPEVSESEQKPMAVMEDAKEDVIEEVSNQTEKSETEVKTAPETPKKNIPDLLEEFLTATFARLVDLVGSHQIKELTAEAHKKCRPYFPALEDFSFQIVPEIKVNLKNNHQWTEKETLGVAVFLETILKSCQNQVYGMSYLNLEDLAGENKGQLKEISFFDYMSHAEEFKL